MAVAVALFLELLSVVTTASPSASVSWLVSTSSVTLLNVTSDNRFHEMFKRSEGKNSTIKI